MNTSLIAQASITINASPAKVWEALTSPDMIKQYLFGTQAISDWKVGSSITYKGVWEGKHYEDKGMVLEVIPEKLLVSTYWSSMSGVPDIPENYKKVTYELTPAEEGATTLTVTQDNNVTEESKAHSESNWKMVLDGLKKVVEEK